MAVLVLFWHKPSEHDDCQGENEEEQGHWSPVSKDIDVRQLLKKETLGS